MLDMDAYLGMTRLSDPRCGPGARRVFTGTTLAPDGASFVSAVWELDIDGGPARRLTTPAKGTGVAGFLPDGSLLLRLVRADGEVTDDPDAEVDTLWLLPVAGGEPRRVLAAPAGIGTVAIAAQTGTVAMLIDTFPDAADLDADRELAKARKDAGASGLWFDGYPVRYWDHLLAPRAPRLYVADRTPEGGLTPPRDVTGDVGRAFDGGALAISPDGSTAVVTWQVEEGEGRRRRELVAVDLATGRTRVLGDRRPGGYFMAPTISPDGRWVAATAEDRLTTEHAPQTDLLVVPLDGSAPARRLAADTEHWPHDIAFTAGSDGVLFSADELGRAPVFLAPLAEGAPTVRLSADGAFGAFTVDLDGGGLVALRTRITTPPELVELDPAGGPDQRARVLHAAPSTEPLGELTEVHATAADGTALRGWLVLPDRSLPKESPEGPSPLAVFLHGGPLNSWNAWAWRWNPNLLAARGYAVLLPDPALSTGYGQQMVERGWQQWGGAPYDDAMLLVDAALAHPDVDAERAAVLGGSYGGYLTNWTIGHTDRFRCAVTHASIWELTGFEGITDDSWAWRDWFGDPVARADFYREWSPSTYADAITTPTLVIHGERDFRCPVGESLRLWTALQERGVDSRLLYFPDENHWVLKPGNSRIWYDAVLGWLDSHLRGSGWRKPALT